MSERRRQAPPLSPVLFAGFALRPLPTALLQPFLSRAMSVMHRRHRDVFGRMESLRNAVFLIEPVDLPFRFLLRPAAPRPVLRLVADEQDIGNPSAVIRGPLSTLIDLLEGRLDGDAMFFTRDLVIEGDTEAGDGYLGELVPFAAFSNGFYYGKAGVALVAAGRTRTKCRHETGPRRVGSWPGDAGRGPGQ